jgi:4-hydroxy-tetrahydrodipicolinate reductase
MTTGLAINGAAGRMGRTLLSLIEQAPDLSLAGAFEQDNHPQLLEDSGALIGKPQSGLPLTVLPGRIEADVVIDFSLPGGTERLLDVLETHPLPLICGTTGLSEAQQKRLHNLAAYAPVVFAPNFSTGVNVLFDLVRRAARLLKDEIEAEVTEIHHKHKKDAPSGTAARLVEILADELSVPQDGGIRHGREGLVGERPRAEIGVHALRGGEVVGEHTVYLFGNGERLELTHKLQGREALAGGALVAARWALGKPAGLYSMTDVLGL